MDEIISLLKTPEECQQIAKIFNELAQIARRRAVQLRAQSHGSKSAVETELLEAIYAYEEVLSKKNNRRTHANRTWQMVKHYGIINAAERAVNRPADAMGYRVLVEMGFKDLTFESIIVRFPSEFDPELVKLSRKRLQELEKS